MTKSFVVANRISARLERIPAYAVGTFPFDKLSKIAQTKKNKKYQILSDFMTFDIETTTIKDTDSPTGFMYHWQACIQGFCVYGRRWEEFIELLQKLHDVLELSPDRRFVCYVHNLGYEFQFIKDFLAKQGDFKMFARATRKPIYVLSALGIEFRCSYILSNMSLSKFCLNEYGAPYTKLIDKLDYSKIRTPNTVLHPFEFRYNMLDVLALYHAIKARLKNEHDTLSTIPLTSTGYVRREVKKRVKKNAEYMSLVRNCAMPMDVYNLLKDAGRGGDTHANRHYAGQFIADVDSFDAVSDYPYQLLSQKYPITAFVPYGEVETLSELDELVSNKACLFRLSIINPRVKKGVPMPYIPTAKCLKHKNIKADNGRILQADFLQIAVTDIDFKIIKETYDNDGYYVDDMHTAEYGYLPECLREAIRDYFIKKTQLKIALSKKTISKAEIENLEYLYAKSKNRLNAIFGMMYTDPIHFDITIDKDGNWHDSSSDLDRAIAEGNKEKIEGLEKLFKEKLDKANNSKNTFLVFAWGVWCTALARLHLQKIQKATNSNGGICLYCDTDSSKAHSVDTNLVNKLNDEIIKTAEETGAYADVEGKRFYLGFFEKENKKPLQHFCTLGAKKYVYADSDELHITIAGVNKKEGAKELENIYNFKPGFVFRKAAGQTLYYNQAEIHDMTYNGVTFTTASNIGMIDSTYELGVTDEYAALIFENILDI